ncbi:MAG: hypothetical protein AAF680_00585 [Pseudomonadota bacterium]
MLRRRQVLKAAGCLPLAGVLTTQSQTLYAARVDDAHPAKRDG